MVRNSIKWCSTPSCPLPTILLNFTTILVQVIITSNCHLKYFQVWTWPCWVCTSSANILSLSAQDSMSARVSLISEASSLMRLAPSMMVVKALSRSFLIWMSNDVRLARPSSSGVGKLGESRRGAVQHSVWFHLMFYYVWTACLLFTFPSLQSADSAASATPPLAGCQRLYPRCLF